MLNGPLAGKLVVFALPLALASILQQLLNTADASIAGRVVSSYSLAGIGAVVPVTAMFVNFFVGISVGANVAVAMRIGSGELQRVREATHTSMALACLLGLSLAALGLAISDPVLSLIGMPADARPDALIYLRIYCAALPFLTVYNFAAALLRAHGDTTRPLYALLLATVLNIALNLLFAKYLLWGTAGIALATLIACAASCVLCVAFLMREEEPYRLDLHALRIRSSPLKDILVIGLPTGIQGSVFSLSNTVVQAAINGYGSAAIAGSAATLNYEYYTFFAVNAFTQAAITFTSQNYAAGKHDRCRRIFKLALLFGFVSSLATSLIFTALGETGLSVFTTDPDALRYAVVRLFIVELPCFLVTFYEIPGGALRGMGCSTAPAVVTVLGSVVLRVIFVALIYPLNPSYEFLMAVYPISWLFMIACMSALYAVMRTRKLCS